MTSQDQIAETAKAIKKMILASIIAQYAGLEIVDGTNRN